MVREVGASNHSNIMEECQHMNIYSFDNVITLLKKLGGDTIYHAHREYFFKTKHKSLYQEILEKTENINSSTFTERLFCYANDISQRPSCKLCSKYVTFNKHKRIYHSYCSQRCSIRDMKSLIGVENPSQLQMVKDIKRKVALMKYGVDNVSKSEEIKNKISQLAIERWEKNYSILGSSLPSSIKEYHRIVRRFTEYNYKKHKDILDPGNLRSKNWHLDHKFSIFEGYRNGIAPEIIGHTVNLEILSSQMNSKIKNKKCSITLAELHTALLNWTE